MPNCGPVSLRAPLHDPEGLLKHPKLLLQLTDLTLEASLQRLSFAGVVLADQLARDTGAASGTLPVTLVRISKTDHGI